MSPLQAARRDLGRRGPFAPGLRVNELRGWRILGRSGAFPLVDAPAGRILRIISFEAIMERCGGYQPLRSFAREVPKSRANISGNTARNSER